MPDSLLKQYQHYNSLQTSLDTYWSACHLLHRRNDLAQLVRWAKRKRLAKPRNLYQYLLLQEEQRLWRYEHRAPFITSFAKFLVGLSDLLNPTSKHKYRRGYAATYYR